MTRQQGFVSTYSRLLWQLALTLFGALLYVLSKGHPLSLAPLLIVPFFIVSQAVLKREKPEQDILLGFIILSFIIDDISQVAWGRSVDTWTEALGALLFQSFGITGMEAFIIAFGAWIIFVQLPKNFRAWSKLGFFTIAGVAFSVFFLSLLAGGIGLSSGGDWRTMFIQIRFLHALPLWVLIGFTVWRDPSFTEKVLKWITILVSLKSFQALYVYGTNLSIFREEEYLLDHYYSGFAVLGLIGLVFYFFRSEKWTIKLLCVLSALAISSAFILNDRRTSYVGVVFAVAVLPTLLPVSTLKRYAGRGLLALAGLGLFTALTWNLPPPLGFLGSLYRSFGSETGLKEPSYRDLENANLINAVTEAPSTGIGYGKEFDEVYPLPDISMAYDRYRMIPHNTFLSTWAYAGPHTIAAMSLVFAVMIAASGQMLKRGRRPIEILLGVMALFYTLQYLTYTFGDLGFQIMRNQMMAGLLLGACFRLSRQEPEFSEEPKV